MIFHMIPQEWIIGPAPSAENNYNQRPVSTESWIDSQMEPAAEILLDKTRMETLNDRQKIRLMQQFARQQAASLGLHKQLRVEVADLEEGRAGEYRNDTGTICIDEQIYKTVSMDKLIVILCHEVRHAYQFALADAWQNLGADSEYAELELFSVMEACYEGLRDYCHASEDMEAYQNQWVEVDAREYADKQLMEILLN